MAKMVFMVLHRETPITKMSSRRDCMSSYVVLTMKEVSNKTAFIVATIIIVFVSAPFINGEIVSLPHNIVLN